MRRFPGLHLVLPLLLLPAAAFGAEGDLLSAETFSGLTLRGIGPALTSGRIADLAVHPTRSSTWYVAAGSGGVWKTTNAGSTWTPVFDGQGSYSIGCITLDPGNPEVVWVGTGENVSGRHVGYGDGVYKSLDGGTTWKNMGLGASEHVARILVDPRDSRRVYVAAEGPLWSSGGERGVYLSEDGGGTWTAILTVDENTGVGALEMDPRNPDVLYAASYQRRRHVWGFLAGGPGSGIHKSTDGGKTWRRLQNGLPQGDLGKIGLAVSPLNPRLVYATIEASEEDKGFYRSDDAGESWKKENGYTSGGTGGHYYQEIYASPHQLDRVYQMDVWVRVTEDGGKSFHRLPEATKHSDSHAMAFFPDDSEHLLVGCDGGLFETFDHGETWRFHANLPLTQFYKIAVDNDLPFYNVIGGTQDNGTQLGPSRTPTRNGIRNRDWAIALGADGYSCAIDPEDPDTVYAEWQVGNLVRIDRRTGERIEILPAEAPGEPPERFNWDSPILISPHSHDRLYFGSQRLWRSDDQGDSWRPVSGDLTRGRNRYEMPYLGRTWSVDSLFDHRAMSYYATTTAISESPRVEGLLYVGTDDGLIQVSEDGGGTWRRAEGFPDGVPELAFVHEVTASAHTDDVVYAVLDAHKRGDMSPYVLKSADRGRSWASVSGDLPERLVVYSLVEDPVRETLLFAGTELGIYFTLDGGGHWIRLTGGVPTIAFRDLVIQARESDLVGASFGRGLFVFDDYSPLRSVTAAQLAEEATVFPVRTARLFNPSVPLDLPGKSFQGDSIYLAPNPPFGAVFTYYLKDSLKTSRDERREGEKKIREAGGDVPFPGWERLRSEDREEKTSILLTVTDASGEVVRRIPAPSEKGFHRVAWDLRYPPPFPVRLEAPGPRDPWDEEPVGPLAAPGSYTVTLGRLAAGELRPLGEPQVFEVVPLQGTADAEQWARISAFQRRTAELVRRASGVLEQVERAQTRLDLLEKALLCVPGSNLELLAGVHALRARQEDLHDRLAGDPTRGRLSEPAGLAFEGRLMRAVGSWRTSQGPTAVQRESLETAASELVEVSELVRELVEVDLRKLEEAAEAAGAPWTPGR